MDRSRETVSHKRLRAVGGDTCIRPLVQRYPSGNTMVGIHGQYNGRSIHKQTGRDQVSTPLFRGRDSDQNGLDTRSRDQSPASARQTERFGRRSISTEPDTRFRVEPAPTNLQTDLCGVRDTEHRPVRNVQERKTSSFLFTPSRERGLHHGCNDSQLGRDIRVRLSPDRVLDGSTPQDREIIMCSVTNSTTQTNTTVVSPITQPVSRHTTTVTSTQQTAQAARSRHFSRFNTNAKVTRLEAIKRSYEQTGLPREVSEHLSRKNRQSSARTYEAKWRVYVRWCHGRRINPLSAPIDAILSFFCYLFDRLGLKPTTIDGYRAMLGPIYRAKGLDLSTNRVVSDLLSAFRTQRPKLAPTLPDWDISFVLYCLTRQPWEPLQDISLKRLTLKTFFLLLLASGRRRSDLGAIDVTRISYRADGSMLLYPERGFLPKTVAATEGERAFSPICIPDLKNYVGANEPDAYLCPVRAVRIYVARTNRYRHGRNRLFLSYQMSRTTNITTSTLSLWVKLLVRSVYTESGAESRDIYKISAHQLRHVAMSLASRTGSSLESIIRAGMWTNPNTFISYYLSQVTEVVAQTTRFRIGPIIAGQSVVTAQ